MDENKQGAFKLTRRGFLKTTVVGTAAIFAGSSLLLGGKNEAGKPVLDFIEVPIKGLHPSVEGFKVIHITDIHLSLLTHIDVVKKAVALANSVQPDVALITGDHIWKNSAAMFDLAPTLTQINARHGVFASLGNHELWANEAVVKQAMQEAGLPLLENQGVDLPVGKGSVYIAGLDDAWSGDPDLDASLADNHNKAPVILMCHEPDVADHYARTHKIALQLSGHTHAGQVRLPLYGPVALPYLGRKYEMGLYRVEDMWLYTNRGLGVISVPLRYNCPPEVTVITLVRA